MEARQSANRTEKLTDLHATILHQLGLDSRRKNVLGRKRLEIDYGKPIRAIIA